MQQVLLFSAVTYILMQRFYQPVVTYITRLSEARPNMNTTVDRLEFAEQYIAAIIAGLLCWFGKANIFPDLNPTMGLILTAAVALFAEEIAVGVKLAPRKFAEEQFLTAIALREQGVLPISLGTVSYISEEKPEIK